MKKDVRLPAHVRPIRYKIMLRPDFETFTFRGQETIYLTIDKPSKELILHCVELTIDDVNFVGIGKGKVKINKKTETISLTFPKTIPRRKGQLRLTFRGVLTDKMRGFYRSRYETDGVGKYLATTQFEATDARRSFPCFDEPAHKAIFDVTLSVPAHMEAISNTLPSAVWEHEEGYKTVQFLPTPKMSTYLLAFIVGEFEHIEKKTKRGVVVRIFTTAGKNHQARFALDVAVRCLEFYEDYFDIPYPLPVLDLIAIPDFAAGAMENWGAITYREATLLIDYQHSSTANKQRVAIVIAHEVAHQWFGNLVTMEWWSDLWLNEGFASYIEYLAVDHLFPKWQIWAQFVYLDMGVALKLDSLANTHPIEVEVGHPDQIKEIFDKVSYSKGSSVIRMLAAYLGEKDFRAGLRHYLKKHALANAKTEDLWKAFEDVSGKAVGKIMTTWTGKAGYPLIAVRGKGKGERGKLGLTQSRFFSSPISKKENKDNAIWSIPLKTQKAKGKRQNYLFNGRTLNIDKPKEGEWIKVNAGEVSFVRVDYPLKYLKAFEDAVKTKELPVADRLGIIRDAFDMAEAGRLPTDAALALATNYQSEDQYTVWAQIATHLSQINNLLFGQSSYKLFQVFAQQMFNAPATKLGWVKRSKEEHSQTLLRTLALFSLGSYGEQKTISQAKIFFEKITRGEAADPDLRPVIYNLVAQNGTEQQFKILQQMYKKETLAQEKEQIGRAVGLFRDGKILNKTLEFSMSADVRFQDTTSMMSSVLTNPYGRHLAWTFVKKNWSKLLSRYGGAFFMLSRLVESVGEFCRESDRQDVEKFFKTHPAAEIERTIAQTLERISSNVNWLARDREKISAFLHKASNVLQ